MQRRSIVVGSQEPYTAVPRVQLRLVLLALSMGVLYISPFFVPDPSLMWAAKDEVCCHIPTIRAIKEDGLRAAITDYEQYRSATAPLYHMLMSMALDRVHPTVLRLGWVAVTLSVGFLLYEYVLTDDALRRGRRAAVALATAFLLSPTIRASAMYFVTDGLAVHLAIAALVLLRRARREPVFSLSFGVFAVFVAFASFYTRQYYLWATVFVAYNVFSDAVGVRAKIVTVACCLLLSVPAVSLFVAWHGFTPPLGWPAHTTPALFSTLPSVLGLLAVYSLPLMWFAVRDSGRDVHRMTRKTLSLLLVICGMVAYVGTGLALGVEIPPEGGILRLMRLFGSFGTCAFLVMSYLGVVMLVRWLVLDGVSQLWWCVFLLPLLSGSILHQRYFEPAIIVFMFLVARPRDAAKVLDSRLVWFYPLFSAVYTLSRTVYFASSG